VFTYGGEDGDVFSLEASAAAAVRNGSLKSAELVLRSTISLGAISRSISDKNAFEKATKLIVGNMMASMYHRLEIQVIHGQSSTGLGVLESISGLGLKIEDHEWAPGIWNGSKGAKIEIYDATLVTNRGSAEITSVDYSLKKVFVDAVPGGTVATDVIFYKGAKGKEFLGIHEISQKSGTLFGIDNSVYDLFKGNVVNVGTNFTGGEAVLSFAKAEEGIAAAMDKGLAEEAYTLLVSTRSWNNLLTEQAAKRMYDSSYSSSQLDQGSKSLKFYGQNGEIEIMASTIVKEGYAHGFVKKDFARIGSSDVTFQIPGYDGEFFRLLNDSHGIELRSYTDQALVCMRPATCVLFRYIKS